MSRTARIIVGLVVVGALAGAAFLAYIYVRGGSGEASVSIEDAAATRAAGAPTRASSTAEAGAATETPCGCDVPFDLSSLGTAEATEPAASDPASSGVVFSIVSDESEVRFELDEDLRGLRNTVIGRTDQVAGNINVNFDDPSQTTVEPIVINMRTFITDNEFRNRAIRGEIFLSAQDEFEFGEFDPTSLTGLPDAVTMGEPFTFQMTGNLVLRGVSNEVTFDVTVTPVSDTRIEGTAAGIVDRTLYGMEIPNAPGVANVETEVELYIDFVATAG
jgi:polyisoprenoid-binding protein YceI